jgi:hypothetical protein
MTDSVLPQLAALKGASAAVLKARWRTLFDSEPPPYNRRFLESRLAYRIQELAYGGLKKETVERLRVLARQYDGNAGARSKGRTNRMPIAGTQMIGSFKVSSTASPSASTISNMRAAPTSRCRPSHARSPRCGGTAGCSLD